MFSSKKSILLILLHLFIFVGLFGNPYPISKCYQKMQDWDKGSFNDGIRGAIRLYFSDPGDETYYYEWSTVVLGKKFEADYPFEKRGEDSKLRNFFTLPPTPHLPYLDIDFEYPPTMILPILLPRLLVDNHLSYVRLFAFQQFCFYCLCLFFIFKIIQSKPLNFKIAFEKVLKLSLLSLILLGQLYATRLDVVVSLLIILAYYYFIKEKYFLSNFWICLGSISKGFPIFFLPLLFFKLLKEKKWKPCAIQALFSGLFIGGINLFLGYWTHGKYWEAFQYHAERGFQIESMYALIPYLSHLFFKNPIWVYSSHTCSNITSAGLNRLKPYTSLICLIFIGFIYLKTWSSKNLSSENTLRFFLAIPLAFLLTFKALSPQFLIWLTPLIFICTPSSWLRTTAFLIALLLTQIIFPNIFQDLMIGETSAIFLLCFRNLILLSIFISLIKSIRHETVTKN
ncbi:MAG: hypothetical protein HQM15_03825 [Deltaproteobacteria bacterium]|nr:hypothetical protein [Deltaproteobacteria bacterium]